MKSMRFAFPPMAAILGVLCLVNPAAAESSPREALLRLVPPDAGFCLIIDDLRGHAGKLRETPWFKQFQQSPLWEFITRLPEAKKLERFLSQELPQSLRIDWPRLRDDILGDAAIFAYRPGPSGRPEHEGGLFLLWARDGELLAALVKRVNQLQLDSGEVKAVRVQAHRGKNYSERVEQKGESFVYYPVNSPMQMLPVTIPVPVLVRQYYFIDGHLLAFSNDREQVLRVIELAAARTEAGKETPLAASLLRAGVEKSPIALWLNPRAFDSEIQQHAARASRDEAQGLKAFQRYWQALDAAVLSLDVTPDLVVQLSIQGRSEALPAPARAILATASGRSDLWSRFPSGAMITLALRVDAVALKDALADFLTPEARKQSGMVLQQTLGAALGMNLTADVLPQIGPDVGFCIAAPAPLTLPSPPAPGGEGRVRGDAPAEKSGLPHVLAAVRVRPGSKTARVDTALLKALRFFASLAVFDHNRRHGDHVRLESVTQGDVEVSFLTGGSMLPSGLQPAAALKGGYLVLANTPDAIRRFRADDAEAAQTAPAPLLRLSVPRLLDYLLTRREPIAAFLAANNHLSRETNQQWLAKIIQTLTLFDGLEVTQRAAEGQMRLSMRLQTTSKR
jgi:hypothetical protein